MHKRLLNPFLKSSSDNRKSKTCPEPSRRIQNRKWVGIVALGIAFAMCGALALAQQPAKIARLGSLSGRTAPTPATPDSNVEALQRGLRELGYVEGKNIAVEYRFADGKNDRLPDLAADLVRLQVDVIVSAAIQPSLAAKKATSTIPIVFAGAGDPVAWSLVESLARPGGTGDLMKTGMRREATGNSKTGESLCTRLFA